MSPRRWERLPAAARPARGRRQGARSAHGRCELDAGDLALVLIGSTAGLFGEAGHADYAAAKSAIVHGLLLSLKNEIVRIAPGGRVNAV